MHGVMTAETETERPLCGAKTRNGGTCRKDPLQGKRRCRFHGGLSTGPRTAAGKARTRTAMRKGYFAWYGRQRAEAILSENSTKAERARIEKANREISAPPGNGYVQYAQTKPPSSPSSFQAQTDFDVF